MFHTTYIKQATVALALAVSLATLTAPQVLAGGNSRYGPPDPWYHYAAALTKASNAARYGAPDGWYPYVVSLTRASHGATILDGRSPDTKDAAASAQERLAYTRLSPVERIILQEDAIRRAQVASLDGRSPDTIDAAVQAHVPVVTIVSSPGFAWRDFGIGVAAACGAMLLLGLSIRLLTARQSRKQPSPVATA